MQIKKLMSIIAAFTITLSLAACSSANPNADSNESAPARTEQAQQTEQADTTESEKIDNGTTSKTVEDTQVADKQNDTLIVYYSAANMNDVDAVTSATPLIDGSSTVEWIANIIHVVVGELKTKSGENIFMKLSEHFKNLQDKQEKIMKKHNSLSVEYDELEHLLKYSFIRSI